MIPLDFFSQRTYIIASVSAAVLLATGLLLSQAYAPLARAVTSNTSPSTSANTVYLSPEAAATSTPAKDVVHEVHIANNGLTLLRGARVLSSVGKTIRVGMTWGSSDFAWSIETSYSTRFLDEGGEKISINEIRVGDIVTITGTIVENGKEPRVSATIVRK